jgi:hypothetical protein
MEERSAGVTIDGRGDISIFLYLYNKRNGMNHNQIFATVTFDMKSHRNRSGVSLAGRKLIL